MIYDCFLYNGENACLKIRKDELASLGIKHVLIEGFYTFTNIKKDILFFGEYNDIYPYYCIDMPNNGNAWDNEKAQRNCISQALDELGAKDDDIIIISDVDEIPRASAIEQYKPEMGLTALVMDTFWYKFNCLAERQSWVSPKILTYAELKKSTPNEVRCAGFPSKIENAGWHMSYAGDADFITRKLASFSHTEYNVAPYNNKEEIAQKIEDGIALWGGNKFEFVQIDETFPKYLYEHQEEFKHLIKRL